MADKQTKTETIQVRCEPELISKINAQRRLADDPPTKSEMARILIDEAILARQRAASTAAKSKA